MFLTPHIRFLAFFILLIPCIDAAQALEFKQGEWELSVKTTISGMPTGAPVTRYRQCLTSANPIPTVFLQARSCDVMQLKESHRTLRYKVNCFTEHGSLINEGKVRYSAVKLKGTAKSDLGNVAGRNSVLRYKFTGRYLGACY